MERIIACCGIDCEIKELPVMCRLQRNGELLNSDECGSICSGCDDEFEKFNVKLEELKNKKVHMKELQFCPHTLASCVGQDVNLIDSLKRYEQLLLLQTTSFSW